jgi:hypothetical protein
MWHSGSSWDGVHAWRAYAYDQFGLPIWGDAVLLTFPDPKPVMASLGFTLNGDVALQYWWQGDTASTSPHTSGWNSLLWNDGWDDPRGQDVRPGWLTTAAGIPSCAFDGRMVGPYTLSVTGKRI